MFFFEILIPKNIRKGSLNNVNLSRWQEQARLYNTAIYELCLLNGELSKMVSIKNNSGNTMNLWSENSIKPGSNEDESRWELAGESLHECFLNFHCSVKRAVRVTWELTRVQLSIRLSGNSHHRSNVPHLSLTLIKIWTSSKLISAWELMRLLAVKREESCDSIPLSSSPLVLQLLINRGCQKGSRDIKRFKYKIL